MRNISQILMDSNVEDIQAYKARAHMYTQVNSGNDPHHKGMGMRFFANDWAGSIPHADMPFIYDANSAQGQRDLHNLATAMDVDTVGYDIPSNGAPQALTSIFSNMIMTQLFQTTPFSKITTDFQNGVFGNTNIFVPSMSARGKASVYGGYSTAGRTGVNANWMERDVVYLQRSISYEDLTVAQMALAKINIVDNLRTFNAQLIGIDINNIGFSGYAGLRCYGLLNDPSLAAALVAPQTWANATYLEIYQDVLDMYSAMIGRAGGQVDQNIPAYLVVPPAAYTYLLQQNALGTTTVMTFLKNNFPALEIVQAQNLQNVDLGAGALNYAMLLAKEIGGQPVALNAFVTPYYSHGVYRLEDYYGEKISYAPAGGFVVRAMGIQLLAGI